MEQATPGKMTKLLHKPFKTFTLFAIVLLLCNIPAYLFVVDAIWAHELDEYNEIISDRIKLRFKDVMVPEDKLQEILHAWQTLQPGTKLIKTSSGNKEGIYEVTKLNDFAPEEESDRFRGLETHLTINGEEYLLTVETNIEEVEEIAGAIGLVTLGFFLLLVLGFILLNKRISRKIWRPFQDSLATVKNFDLTASKEIELEPSNIEEFEEMNDAIRKLTNANLYAYNQQKTFIENASHELQTPLAVLKSKMDMLLQSESLTTEQSTLLHAIELPLARITRINKNLLLLAKIENKQFGEADTLNLDLVLHESLEFLQDYIEEKDLELAVENTSNVALKCNRFLLETLLNNLLINAITHTPKNGSIKLEQVAGCLKVRNSGKTELNSKKLFMRFAISSQETTNSGLGLAIAKEICNRYGWQLSYNFEGNYHVFSLTF